MERVEALVTLQAVVAEVLAIDPALVAETSSLRDDLEADSLDLIEIVTAAEDKLGVRIPEEHLKTISTVGDALNLLTADLRVDQ